MQKRKKLNITMALITAAALAVGIPCYAGTTDEKIETLTQESQEVKLSLASAQDRIAALEAKKGDAEGYLTELNTQLSEMTDALLTLQNRYDEKQAEIVQTQTELEAARLEEESQYEAMKLRIQYMYEEGVSSGGLEALFSAESFTDFLNRAEEIGQLNQYDRDMLESYENTVIGIEEKEALLARDQESIAALQAQQQEQKAVIEEVYENAYREYQACIGELESSENEYADLIGRVQSQEEELNSLLEQKYAEEAAANEAAAQAAAEQAAAAQAAAEQTAEQQVQTDAGQPAQTETAGSAEVQNAQDQTTADYSAGAQQVQTDTSVQADQGSNLTYLGNFTLTAYCSCAKCCGKWAAYGGITASGASVQEGVTVAMGGVPFGTKLMINGHVYTVQDRGTPYGHVDIWFPTHEQACAFGMQYADVYLVN